MRDFSLLDSAIDEMERVLLGNKPREAEEIYLQNAIDFIERFIKQLIEESKLNENQQIVLNWLKEEMKKRICFLSVVCGNYNLGMRLKMYVVLIYLWIRIGNFNY